MQNQIDADTDLLNEYNQSLLPANTTDFIIHIKPIVMLFNRYEMSNLNGWDGNKLYIDETNEQYMLAPQIGAGRKNSDNTFTGMVMGIKKVTNQTSQQVGLFGFANGVQSVFLNAEDGSATFGTSAGGQIQINPNTTKGSYIQSGDFSTTDKKGSRITLSPHFKIETGSGNFEVNENGHLTAKGGGTIGGWDIGNEKLYSNNIELNANGSIKHKNGTWSINQDGSAKFDNLIANSGGSIGGFTIGSSSLTGSGVTLGNNKIEIGTGISLDGGGVGKLSCGGISLGNGILTGTGFSLSATGLSFTAGGASLTAGGFSMTEGSTKVGNQTLSEWTVKKIQATDIKVDHLIAGTIQGKTVGWSNFTALAGFNSSTVYRVRLANGGEADIRSYENPQLNQILALANVSSS